MPISGVILCDVIGVMAENLRNAISQSRRLHGCYANTSCRLLAGAMLECQSSQMQHPGTQLRSARSQDVRHRGSLVIGRHSLMPCPEVSPLGPWDAFLRNARLCVITFSTERCIPTGCQVSQLAHIRSRTEPTLTIYWQIWNLPRRTHRVLLPKTTGQSASVWHVYVVTPTSHWVEQKPLLCSGR